MDYDKEKILKAGKIASEARNYAKEIIKPGIPLIEIAEKIEFKIRKSGGDLAFPVNLSIDEIAAHYTPDHQDGTLAKGLIKVDLGVSIDGWLSDTAFSVNLSPKGTEEHSENEKLIVAAQEGLNSAINYVKNNKQETSLSNLGKEIESAIKNKGKQPIVNLTGHSMNKYDLHSGISIFNIENNNRTQVGSGLVAIEPFTTSENGTGRVKNGINSGIFLLVDLKPIRNPNARKILKYIHENYNTLPFCSRWLVNEFGTSALLALRQLEKNGNLHNFPQLIETSGTRIAQAEHTLLIDEETNEVLVTTE